MGTEELSTVVQLGVSTPAKARTRFHTFRRRLKGTGGDKKMEMEISLRSLPSIARAHTHLSTTRTNVSPVADLEAAFSPRRRMHIPDLRNRVATGCKRVQPYTVAPGYATATQIDPVPRRERVGLPPPRAAGPGPTS